MKPSGLGRFYEYLTAITALETGQISNNRLQLSVVRKLLQMTNINKNIKMNNHDNKNMNQ